MEEVILIHDLDEIFDCNSFPSFRRLKTMLSLSSLALHLLVFSLLLTVPALDALAQSISVSCANFNQKQADGRTTARRAPCAQLLIALIVGISAL